MPKLGVSMEVGSDGVAVITISNPPVNALAPPIIDGLKRVYTAAMRRDDVKAIVVTDAKKPSVAAIQGLALGGGLELAMACHARISTPDAQLGLPELTLGVIPGFGGTQRLPRLVGLSKAIDMMLLSQSVSANEGYELGLIDSVVSYKELLEVSRHWALDIARRCKPWMSSLRRTDKIGSLSDAHAIIKAARQQAKGVAPNMPQHQACLDAIEEGIIWGGYSGILKSTTSPMQLPGPKACL